MNLRILIALIGLLAMRADAFSCTVAPRDALTIVEHADTIVRVRALDVVEDGRPPNPYLGRPIRFEVVEQLRGNPVTVLTVNGHLGDLPDMNPDPVPYGMVRRTGRSGSCYARTYQRGGEYLLLMKDVDGVRTPYWAPLSATNEQIVGDNDKWLLWVKERLNRLKEAGK